MNLISIKNLSKKYGKKIVFENLNLELTTENIYFLTSINGSGKTTFFKCLLRDTKYDGYIYDKSVKYAYLPEKIMWPSFTSLNYYLKVFITLENDLINDEKNLQNVIDNYLLYFKIDKYKYQSVNTLSKGTKQKTLIIKTILSNADVYLFDEPLTGLDKKSREIFMQIIKTMQEQGKLIIIASHYYDDYKYDNKKVINLNEETY